MLIIKSLISFWKIETYLQQLFPHSSFSLIFLLSIRIAVLFSLYNLFLLLKISFSPSCCFQKSLSHPMLLTKLYTKVKDSHKGFWFKVEQDRIKVNSLKKNCKSFNNVDNISTLEETSMKIMITNSKKMIIPEIVKVKQFLIDQFKKRESSIFIITLFFTSVLCISYIGMMANLYVPQEINKGEDAYVYYSVANEWIEGRYQININYDFGLSILEILFISTGFLLSLDPIQSLIILFSFLSLFNICLLSYLLKMIINSKWILPLSLVLVMINDFLIMMSVLPLTDSLHTTLILLIILIELRLYILLSKDETSFQTNKIRIQFLVLGICFGIILSIRHASLIFLLLSFFIIIVYISQLKISLRKKFECQFLIIFPSLLLSLSYFISRCLLLGDINYFYYFGANSNIWIDSLPEMWYYFNNGLSNPTLNEYLENHSLFYIFQRELLGILHIFTRSLFPQYIVFFLAIGFAVLLERDYKILIIFVTPILYISSVYGWFWDNIMSPQRYLLPVHYIFYIATVIAIFYLIFKNDNINIILACLFVSVFWVAERIIEFPTNFMEIFSAEFTKIPFLSFFILFISFFILISIFFFPWKNVAHSHEN